VANAANCRAAPAPCLHNRFDMYNERQAWAIRIVLGITAVVCVVFLAV
jgi:hypothetical protein